jgi:hypothetical protein
VCVHIRDEFHTFTAGDERSRPPSLILFSLDLSTRVMDYAKEGSTSVYDYSDKSIAHAGYAAIAFALASVFTAVLVCIQYFLYHRPGTGGFQGHKFLSEQYLQHTPLIPAIVAGSAAIVAAISGVLAFFIFRRSRFAVIAMLVFVVALQLYGCFVAHSPSGTILSIVVVGFLLRGARRILQGHAERQLEPEKV